MLRIGWRRDTWWSPEAGKIDLTEKVRAWTEEGVVHARCHIQTNKAFRILQAHVGCHAVVVVYCTKGWNGWIAPAMIDDELAAVGSEPLEIRIRRIDRSSSFLVS